MSIYDILVKTPQQFQTFAGLSTKEFDLLIKKIEKEYPKLEEKRLSRKDRRRAMGAGRKFTLDMRDRVLLLLFYYRTYSSQRLAAFIFRIGQAVVCRSIAQIEPIVKKCIPIPAKIHEKTHRISGIKELQEVVPGLRVLTDAGEQQIRRPKRRDMERSHYSGKAGRHTAKVQYTTNIHGLILHKTRHSPGRIHDITTYKMKPPSFPKISSPDGRQLTIYADRGYQGAPGIENAIMVTPIKKKKGERLTDEQKQYNKLHSRIRIYVEHAIRRVKTWRIMGNVYRNPLIRYDRINDIVCGLVNLRTLHRLAQMT